MSSFIAGECCSQRFSAVSSPGWKMDFDLGVKSTVTLDQPFIFGKQCRHSAGGHRLAALATAISVQDPPLGQGTEGTKRVLGTLHQAVLEWKLRTPYPTVPFLNTR